MKKILAFAKRNAFVLFLAAAFVVGDYPLSHANPIGSSPLFLPNDFEVTRRAHPEKVWDKVFFGNSSVISSYDESRGGARINLGLDYGKVTDLANMLEGGYATVGSDLVVGLNFLTLYDNLDTNKTYIWHKGPLEPYVYFERDRIAGLIKNTFDGALDKNPHRPDSTGATKALYYGNMTDEQLAEKRRSFYALYWDLPLSEFADNLAAVDRVIAFCARKDIRLRVIWMPWSPLLDVPQIARDVQVAANAKFEAAGIETIDLMGLLEARYFHDFGHLTAEEGRALFTDYVNESLSEGQVE